MTPVIDSAINKHIMADDPHGTLAAVRMMNYVKADGSVPFTARQKGVAGVEQNDLATIGDIDFRVNGLKQESGGIYRQHDLENFRSCAIYCRLCIG